MTNQAEPSGKANRNKRVPDPGAWTRSEVDKDIAGLRNALDEHLRGLDAPSSPPQAKLISPSPPPRLSYQYIDSNSDSSRGRGDYTNRTGIVLFAAVSGLVFGIGIGVTVYMGSLGRFSPPNSDVHRSQGSTVNPPSYPHSKHARQAPPAALPRAERPRSEGDRSGYSEPRPEVPPSSASTTPVRWQACLDQDRREAEPPQPGETWWPVVGPSNSLEDARRHCRADAFINRSGNAQISSFRDRETATSFAEQLTQDSSHPWRFWVGEVSVR